MISTNTEKKNHNINTTMAKPVIKKSGDGEDWLATYADAIAPTLDIRVVNLIVSF